MKFSAARILQHMPVAFAVFCAVLLSVSSGTIWADTGTVFIPVSQSASVPPVSVSFETGFSLLTGTVREYVMERGKTVSRLDWRMSGIPVLAAAGAVSFRGAVFTAGFSAAVPVRSGRMEDFDFLIADSSAVSHYSLHDLYTDKFLAVSVSAGYRAQFGRVSVCPSAGFRYRSQMWTAKNGFTQYPESGSWTGAEEKTPVSGSIVRYEQSLRLPYIALEASFEARREVSFNLNAALYPYIMADASDTHVLRNVRFFDSMRGGCGFIAGGSLRLFNVNISVSYEYLSVMTGTSATSSTDFLYPIPSRGVVPGFDSSLWRVSVSYRWRRPRFVSR